MVPTSQISYDMNALSRQLGDFITEIKERTKTEGLESVTERAGKNVLFKVSHGGVDLQPYTMMPNGVGGPDPRKYKDDKSIFGALVLDFADLLSMFGLYFNPKTKIYDKNGSVIAEQTF